MDNIKISNFSNTKPHIFNNDVLEKMENMFKIDEKLTITTGQHLYKLYDDYIKPNMFPIVVIVIVVLILTMKYYIKKHNDKIKVIDTKEEQEINLDEEIEDFTLETEEEEKDVKKTEIEKLGEEYVNALKDKANELISPTALKELYEKKKNKLSFDKISKIIVDGDDEDD